MPIDDEAERIAEDNRKVIWAFCHELRTLDLMPGGFFQWTEEGARKFARKIADEAMKKYQEVERYETR